MMKTLKSFETKGCHLTLDEIEETFIVTVSYAGKVSYCAHFSNLPRAEADFERWVSSRNMSHLIKLGA